MLHRFALAVGQLLELFVLVEGRVGGAKARVSGGVDALLFAIL